MRTTVSIDDELLRIARTRATAEGRTLSELVTEALRERLARRPGTGTGRGRERYAALTAGQGGVQAAVDITDNAGVRDLMDAG